MPGSAFVKPRRELSVRCGSTYSTFLPNAAGFLTVILSLFKLVNDLRKPSTLMRQKVNFLLLEVRAHMNWEREPALERERFNSSLGSPCC